MSAAHECCSWVLRAAAHSLREMGKGWEEKNHFFLLPPPAHFASHTHAVDRLSNVVTRSKNNAHTRQAYITSEKIMFSFLYLWACRSHDKRKEKKREEVSVWLLPLFIISISRISQYHTLTIHPSIHETASQWAKCEAFIVKRTASSESRRQSFRRGRDNVMWYACARYICSAATKVNTQTNTHMRRGAHETRPPSKLI